MTRKQRKIFYPTIFFIGIILMYFQIKIFRNTIINWLIPASIIIVVGIVTFILDYKNYGETYDKNGIRIYFYSLLQSLCGFGFIACSIFTITNYYFADQNSKTESYAIVDRTSIRGTTKFRIGKEQPVFTINYKGKNKELVFNNRYYDKMNEYKSVEFIIRNGFFGFDILENKKLN